LAYAEASIPVFPCVVGGKAPATAHGFQDATTSIEQIDAWWGEADYNLALCPENAGWCVIDLDPDCDDLDVPDTYEVKTPRGAHLYFKGSLPPTTGELGEHIDTRGVGSYVLVPPSIVDGKTYEVLHDRDIAELPAWVAERVQRPDERRGSSVSQPDLGTARARARSHLASLVQRGDVAIVGRGGDTRTFQLACELLNLGVSSETARELLEEIWNPHCLPPWTSDELAVKVDNAVRYAQNEPGAWGVEPAETTFRGALDKLAKEKNSPAQRSRFHAEDETEQEEGKDPSWLIKDLFPELSTILTVGQSGSYKSFLMLDLALCLATGKSWCGSQPLQMGPVFYAASEGRHSLKKARRRAWKTAKEFDGGIPDFFVMPTPIVAYPEDCQEFGDEIARRCGDRKPAIIFLDTVAKCMAGLNENDAGDAGRFVKFCDSLVDAFGCSVVAVHHQSDKDGASVVRGSSALRAGFDSLIHVKAHRATKAVEMRVLQHKDADEPEYPWTFEGKVVGPSLVFQPTTPDEHRALTGEATGLDRKSVGAMLKSLNAIGPSNAVTTHVLAMSLVPAGSSDDLIKTMTRSLTTLGRGKLEAYCQRQGRDLTWFLPL
jgi:hypothetical protein